MAFTPFIGGNLFGWLFFWLFGLDTDLFTFKQRAKQPTSGPQLEAKVMDCRSPSQLAKADLPSTSCDSEMFVSFSGDHC